MGSQERGQKRGIASWMAGAGLVGAMVLAGCSGGASSANPPVNNPPSSVTDSGTSVPPGSTGGGVTPGPDSGTPVGGGDGGVTDAGRPAFGGPGPWPVSNVSYGAADGILEQPVVGASTDESQNLWVATHAALYLLQPGQTHFKRFAAADGLHLQGNPVRYCDDSFGDKRCPIYGAASDPGISEIVGGAVNEVFVGYWGTDSDNPDWTDPARHSGKLDRVKLKADGTLQVDRFDMVAGVSAQFWHNRTVERMLYDHFLHPHDLYVATEHGVDLMRPDHFRPPNPGEWFNAVNLEWMADHLHPRVCYHTSCVGTEQDNQMMGDWKGLALAPDGQLWVAGRWTAGRIRYDDKLDPNGKHDLSDWYGRTGSDAFSAAFGDPYTYSTAPGFINEPVFRPAQEGDPVDLTAVAVAKDGRVWFSNSNYYGEPNIPIGVAVWDGQAFQVFQPSQLGVGEATVQDIVALPDGRLVFAGANSGLVFYNPATGAHTSLHAGQGIPDDHVLRLELDTMVSPPALHVSTYGGAAVLRVLP